MAESGDEVKLERKKNGSVKKKKKVLDGPPPKASDVAGSKKIRVFKNGDIHHHGVKFVVNTRTTSTMQALLDAVNQRIELPYGAKKLYSTGGKAVKSIDDLENGKDYIAASNVFTPLPYGETKPGEIRWETPGSSFKATPTGSASTITRSRSTEPIVKTEKKKTIRAKSQAPNKLAAPATETTKSDTDIPPLVKKKKIVKKSSIAKPSSGTNGINGVNGTPKKLVKKETNGEKKAEKKIEKPEKLNNGIASPERKKVLKKKVIKKKSEANGDAPLSTIPAVEAAAAAAAAAAATHKDLPRTVTRSEKRVEIKERRESEVSHKAPRSPARSEHSRHSRSASPRRSDTDGESDRDTDRSYNQNTTSSSGSSSRSSSSSSSSSRSSNSSKTSRRTLRHEHHGHQEHHKERDSHHEGHHDEKKEEHHHEHGKHHDHHGQPHDKKDEKHGHHEKKHHDDPHHHEHHGKDHRHNRGRSHSSSSGGSIKSHVSIITRGLPTAHEKRGSYTIERKRTPNGTVHVIHHHSSRHGSPESSRPATRRTDKKRDDHEKDEESDNASVSSGESMTGNKKKGK